MAGAAIHPSADIHPTAIVDPSARIGADVRIGAYTVVGAEVEIGASRSCRQASFLPLTSIACKRPIWPSASASG